MQAPAYIIDPALERQLRGSFAKELCRSIEGYLSRCGMSASGFGRAAVRDRAFVAQRLGKGQRVKLDTADRIRRFIGEEPFRQVLLWEIEAFLAVSGLKAWMAGDWAIRQRAFVDRLFAGASPLLLTIDRFRRWMHAQLHPGELDAVFVAVARELAAAPAVPSGLQADSDRLGPIGEKRMSNKPKLLTTDEAAEYVCLSPRTLERYRVTGEGPKFRKIGRWVRYTVPDLDEWLEACTRSSTSDDGRLAAAGGAR